MTAVQQANVLGGRALREALRTPEALAPTLFIPVFFLIVNFGQAGKIFPSSSTPFLHGQTYAAFQLPISLLLAASFGSAALYLVEDIEGGYFDKLRAAPVSRSALVIGRLHAEAVKSLFITTVLVVLALPFGVSVASGPLGFLLLLVLTSLWAVVFPASCSSSRSRRAARLPQTPAASYSSRCCSSHRTLCRATC